MFFPASGWLAAFLLTIVIEVPIAWSLLRRDATDPVRLVILVVFANLATHPIVWYVLTQPFLVGTWEYLIVAETWAVAAEAVFYWAAFRRIGPARAIVVAIAANAASFAAGLAVGAIWPGVFG